MSRRASGRTRRNFDTYEVAASGPLQINSVSQTAGKAAGGDTISVTGTGFQSGMTSALGTVSNITQTTCNIATAGGSGQKSWTVTVGSHNAQNQTFTYLQAPVLQSVNPTSGPGTITNTGVQIICTNLPPAGSGCPVAGTVCGQTIGSIVLGGGGGSYLTCSFPAPGVGTGSISLSVDGVAATGSVTYTGNAPPTFTSSTSIGPSGGSFTVFGTNFVSGIGATATVGTLSVTFTSSTQITVTLPFGTYTAGSYTLTLTNPDGQSVAPSNGLQIVATQDPVGIFSTALQFWYRATDCTVSGGFVTSIVDKSAAGTNVPTTINQLAYNATDASFANQPSFQLTGSGGVQVASIALGTVASFFGMPADITVAGNNPVIAAYGNWVLSLSATTGKPIIGNATWSASVVNTPCSINGYVNPGGSTSGITVNGATPITAAYSQSTASPGACTLGADFTGTTPSSNFLVARFPEVCGVGGSIALSQIQAYAQYCNLRYQLTASPTVNAGGVTPTGIAGGTFRIAGGNFQPSVVVAIYTSGTTTPIGTVTVNYNSTTLINATLGAGSYSAGTYDLAVQNKDGGQTLVSNAFTISSTNTVMTLLGTTCVLWLEVDSFTQAAGAVTVMPDKSLAQPNFDTITSLAYNASSANFNSKPSASFNGSSSVAKISAPNFTFDPTPANVNDDWWELHVYRIRSGAVGGTNPIFRTSTVTATVQYSAISGTASIAQPAIYDGGVFAQERNAIGLSGTLNAYAQYAGGSLNMGISFGGSPYVTAVRSAAAGAGGTGSMILGDNTGASFSSVEWVGTVVANVRPTGSTLTNVLSIFQTKYGVT